MEVYIVARNMIHARTFRTEVEKYLRSITYNEVLTDKKGNEITNIDGNKITLTRYAIQPKLTDVLTIIDMPAYKFYEQLEEDEDLQSAYEVLKAARESYLQDAALERSSSSGAVFLLKAYFDKSDKADNDNAVTVNFQGDNISEWSK